MAITGSQKAYRYALSNVARSGATRSGYVSSRVFISIGGLGLTPLVPGQHTGFALDSLTITDSLDEVPNTCSFRTINALPTTGQQVVITMGSTNGSRLFAGNVLTVDEVLGNKPTHVRANVSCVDFTWQFGFQKVTKRYTNQSATTIAQDLIATYAGVNGFVPQVQADLPPLDEITYTNEDLTDAMTRLARRIGAYWYVDYFKQVWLFFQDDRPWPFPIVVWNPTLAVDGFQHTSDRSQVLTRVYVEGRGTKVLSPIAAGDTLIPVEAVDMFTVASDVFLKASFQGSDGGAQHLDFTGVVTGGAGAIVGPGTWPSAPVTLTAQAGAGVTAGLHYYATTFVTASGESLPSPLASITSGAVADPTVVPGPLTTAPTYNFHGSNIRIGRQITFKYAYAIGPAAGPFVYTLPSPVSAPITTISNQDGGNPQMSAPIIVPIPYATDPRVQWIFVYARDPVATGANFVLHRSVVPNTPAGGTYYHSTEGGNVVDAGNYAPTSNTTSANQIAISAIPIGATAVTSRKLYRTAAGGGPSQLKLLTTIANNTATTYLDTLADASLGANVPVVDTSALTQPAGTIVPGATSMQVGGTSAFQNNGGWAIIGNGEQVIRYTSIGAGILLGIPASGVGAITAAVNYNSTVTAAPMLTGIPPSGTRSILRPLTAGDELYLVVQVDDAARQASLAAAVGGNGIREEWLQDRRLSITEARARGQATLGLRPLDQTTLSYHCRDINTAAGKTVEVNFTGSPIGIVNYFKIQEVRIDNFRPYPDQMPTYTVQASSARFSFDDWLRRIPTKV